LPPSLDPISDVIIVISVIIVITGVFFPTFTTLATLAMLATFYVVSRSARRANPASCSLHLASRIFAKMSKN